MLVEYFAQVVPSIDSLAAAFAAQMAPPFSENDARTDAEISVMSHVAMGYFNQDQIPIPSGTSAANCVELLLRRAAQERAVLATRLREPFVGRDDCWTDVPVDSDTPSPFTLLEATEEAAVKAYRFQRDEWEAYFDRESLNRAEEQFFKSGSGAPLVLSWTQEVWDPFGIAHEFESDYWVEVPDPN